MDKNEYKVRLEEIKGFFEKRQYQNALTLVQTINWQKVKNARVLCMVADIYSENGLFQKAETILAIAVERGGSPKEVLYRLTKVAIDKRDFETAIDYNRRFVKSYPDDSRKYILKFMLHRAQGAELSEQIDILEPYRNVEAPEPRWLYLLATLYEQVDQPNKLVAVCDEIFLWFHDGDYVLKALELKQKYSSLTEAQQRLLADGAEEEEEENIDYTLNDGSIDYMGESEEVIRNRLAQMVGEITDPVRGSRLEEDDDEPKQGFRELDVEFDDEPATDLFQSVAIPEEPEVVDEDMIPGQMSLEECIRRLQEQKIAQEKARLEAERLEQEARERLQAEIDGCREQIEAVDAQVAEHEDAIVKLQGEKKRLQEMLDDLMTREVPVVSVAGAVVAAVAEPKEAAVAPVEPVAEVAVAPVEEPEAAEETVEGASATAAEESEAEAEAIETVEIAEIEAEAVVEEPEAEAQMVEKDEPETEVEEASIEEEAVTREIVLQAEADEETEGLAAAVTQAEEPEEDLPVIHNPYLKSEHLNRIAAALERRFTGGAAAAAIKGMAQAAKQMIPETKQAAASDLNISGVDVGLIEEALREEEAKARQQIEERRSLAASEEVKAAAAVTDGETVVDADAVETEMANEADAAAAQAEAGASQEKAETAAAEAVSRAQESLLKSLAETRDSTERMLADIETDVKSHTQEIRLGNRGRKKDLVAPIGVKSGEDVTPLTEEQKRTLGYFGPVQGIPEQVATVLDEIHKRGLDAKTSSRGNIIVMGRQGSGKTTLAVNVLKAIEQEKGNTNAPLRVATIDAQWLNENDVAATIDQIAGGGLIIERASELNDETIEALATGLGMRTDGLTVILEDNKKNIAKLMERNEEFSNRFTSQIVVPVFTNHELVSFGRTYALEQGYAIEDKALLELYTLIGDMQRDNQPVTVNDVKEVMDDAIEHASRFKLFKKRKTDKDGFIILMENDFE